MTPQEKRAIFVPLVRERLEHLDDEAVVAILGAAIHRRFVPQGSAAVAPDVHVADTPEALDRVPRDEDRRPDVEMLALDAETNLAQFAAGLPIEEQPEFFRGVEEAATEVLHGRGLDVRITAHH